MPNRRLSEPHLGPFEQASGDLINSAKTAVDGAVLQGLSDWWDEDRADLAGAIIEMLPAIVGGVMQRACSFHGASELDRLADEAGSDLSRNVSELISTRSPDLLELGELLLPRIFDAHQHASLLGIIQRSGLREASARHLIRVLVVHVLGVLGREKKRLGLTAKGFAAMLMNQRRSVANVMSADVSRALNFSAFLHRFDEPSAADIAPMAP